jgi:hypothetical protein
MKIKKQQQFLAASLNITALNTLGGLAALYWWASAGSMV